MRKPLVLITWLDTQIETGWLGSSFNPSLAEVQNVGYLIHQDDELISLACSHIKEADVYGDITTIPSSCVTDVKELGVINSATNDGW